MCSIAGAADPPQPRQDSAQTGLGARLARAIDDLAVAAASGADADDQDVAWLLARAWAVVAAADPQLAARTARYGRERGR
jgi:hypothetical protein